MYDRRYHNLTKEYENIIIQAKIINMYLIHCNGIYYEYLQIVKTMKSHPADNYAENMERQFPEELRQRIKNILEKDIQQ